MVVNVLEYLEAAAEAQIALEDAEKQLTYAQVLSQARAIGTVLAGTGRRRAPIGVVIERNIESIVMFLGVVCSGNFYVPLDAAMAPQRLQVMLETLQPEAVIGLKDTLSAVPYTRTFSYEDMIAAEPDNALLDEIRGQHVDLDPLYALFTSGSTGVPKCVLVSHRSVINLTEQFADTFGFRRTDIFGNQAPFDFDVSVKDIYGAMKQGARLVVIPTKLFSMPAKLVEYLNLHRVTVIIWAVSALRIVAQLKTFRKTVAETLRLIMFSGEVMPPKVLNYWRDAIPGATYVNLYGPTEITCNCTYYIADRNFGPDEPLPIGRPFRNMRVYLLDDSGHEVPDGEQGEICVAGAGVALGYYRDPERTAAAFTRNPVVTDYYDRIYHTGDLGCRSAAGELMFLSRKDNQIKHMGHRIELGEIEAAVNALEMVSACCCIYDPVKEKICLFYQAEAACDRELLLGIADKLPKYMRPNRLFWRESLPLTAHGKLDRNALKQEL